MPRLLRAAPVLCLCLPGWAVEPAATRLDFQGGSEDDVVFARMAAGLDLEAPVTEAAFQTALAAIRLTDRFRAVDGQLAPGPGGARVRLDPWPAIRRLEWAGDARLPWVRKLVRGLRQGMRPGERRLAAWSRDLQGRLVEAGYPEAKVAWARAESDEIVIITVTTGVGALVRRVALAGNPAPYRQQELLAAAGLVPGSTRWSPAVQAAAHRNLRKLFLGHRRYEARIESAWDGEGTVRLTVFPGPRVRLAVAGDRLGLWTSLGQLVPLARADRYSPELLEEGDRRLVRHFRSQGYLDARAGHHRAVTRAGPPADQEVTITYTLAKGQRTRVDQVRFEGNEGFDQAELVRIAGLPGGAAGLGPPRATPGLLDAVEARVKTHYQNRGYPGVALSRRLVREGGRTELVFQIREGPRRLLRWLRLDLPPGGFGDPWGLGECLPLICSDRAVLLTASEQSRTYASDRQPLAGLRGVLTCAQAGAGPMVVTFTLDRPLPLDKGDVARVFTALKQDRLPALGLVRPLARLRLEPADGVAGIRIEVPAQPQETVRRLVVQGGDRTRARAVLRETPRPGSPLALEQLSRAQARLGCLGTFQRVDLGSLAAEGEAAGAGAPVPWQEGDLKLSLVERPPYAITSSFGYDINQGYHVGLALRQLNLGGMGRSLDYGIRAGNGTIRNPTLARMFPTGTYNRSVDAFTVGYTDPWFAPGGLAWLPDRTQFRAEGAYIQELQDLYALRRRRLTSSLQWSLSPRVSCLLGYRWERVDVASALADITAEELSQVARYPAHTVISAPFAQVARDTRDHPLDPTSGMYSLARVEFANQLFRTSPNSSFVKLDLRNQWTWPVGAKARAGVLSLGLRLGLAKPTAASAEGLPLSERFFAGGPFSFRGVQPDALGAQAQVPLRGPDGAQILGRDRQPIHYATPLGGQGLALVNLDYRFPILGPKVWGEVFVDSGQVYQSLARLSAAERARQAGNGTPAAAFPPFRTALGLGLVVKFGVPLKIEYAADLDRILGRPRSRNDWDTQLRSLLISMGFQF